MALKFGTQVEEVKRGPRNTLWGQDLFWWLQNGAPKEMFHRFKENISIRMKYKN
jgi:hypothetical protein